MNNQFHISFHSLLSTARKKLGSFLLLVIVVSLSQSAFAQNWTGNIDTVWTKPGNWSTNAVPTTTTNITIPSGLTNYPVITTGIQSVNRLTINSGAKLTMRGGTLQVDESWRNSGTFTATGGTVQFTGAPGGNPNTPSFATGTNNFFNVIVNSGIDPDFDRVASSKMNVAGDFINRNALLGAQSANFTLTFNGTGNQVDSSASATNIAGAVVINKTAGTLTLSTALYAGSLTLTNGAFSTGASRAVTLTGNANFNGGTANLNASVINITGSFAQGGGVITGGNFSMTVNSTFTTTAGTLTTTGTGALTLSGNWTNNNRDTAARFATVTFIGTATKIINGTAATTFGTIAISSGTVSLNKNAICTGLIFNNTTTRDTFKLASSSIALTVNGDVTINQASNNAVAHSFNIGAGTATVTGNVTFNVSTTTAGRTANLTISSGSLTVGGNITMNNSSGAATNASIDMSGGAGMLYIGGNFALNTLGTLTPGTTSTVVYNGTGSQVVQNGSAVTYANLTINKPSGIATLSGASISLINLNLVLGTLNTTTTLNISGNFSNTGGVLTGAPAASFSGLLSIPSKSISGTSSTTFGAITFANGASYTVSSPIVCSGFTIAPGATATTVAHTAAGTITVNGNATVGQPTAAVTKNWSIGQATATVTGVLTIGGTTPTANFIAKVTISSGILNVKDLTFNAAAGSPANAVLDMTGGAGIVNLSGLGSIGVNYTGGGTLTSSATSVVNLNGTNAQTFGVASQLAFNHIYINNTAGVTLVGNLTATSLKGDLRVQTGTFNNGGYSIGMATGKTLEVADGATFQLSGTSSMVTGTSITKNFAPTSTVAYIGDAQTVTAETYGHLLFSGASGAVVKTMPVTDFTVVGNFSSTQNTATSVSYTSGSNLAFNGNVTIGTGTTFNAGSNTHTVLGNWINNGTFTGGASTIILDGNNATISGTGTHTFNNLTISGTNITSSVSLITVSGNLSSPDGTFTHTGGTLTMSGASKAISGSGYTLDNLTIANTGITSTASLAVAGNLSVNAASTFTSISGKLTMTGTAKTIAASGTASFYDLTVTGSVTTATNFTVTSLLQVDGSLTASAGVATFTGTSLLSGTANLFDVTLNGTSLQLAANATLGIANVYTVTAGALDVTTTTPNIVNFNGTGAQSTIRGTYHHLILSGGNTKTAASAITVNGDLTIAASTTFNASIYAHTLYGNWVNNGTFASSANTITFAGATNSTITGATTFSTLTINKTASSNTVTLASHMFAGTVNMTTGTMQTGADTLTITTNRSGNGIILGTIQHNHAFSDGVGYAFESPYNTITFIAPSASLNSVTVKVVSGSVADFPFSGSINRSYTVGTISGTYTGAVLRLHYEDAELNGNTETAMQLWKFNNPSWTISGKTSNDISLNYVEQTGLTNITGRWTISDDNNVIRWNGANSSDWFTASNWTAIQGAPSSVPSANDIVQIGTVAFTNQPSINNAATAKSIEFGSAKAVTLMLTAGSLTVQGNIQGTWSSNITHSINVGNQTVTVNGNLTLSDGTANHVINLFIGSGTVSLLGSLVQTGGAAVTFSSNGNINIAGDYTYTSGAFTPSSGTITYNGTGAQAIAGLTYNNVTINKASGIATIGNATIVNGVLAISSGQLTLNAATTVAGNINISSGTTLNGGSVTLSVGGNWSNSGTFTPSGGTVSFNGVGAQTIGATTFNNVIVNKASGTATLNGNISVNGSLSVSTGILDISTFTANRSTTGGTLTLANGASLLVGGSAFPTNYSTYTLGNSSTVNYNGTVAQNVYATTYGHLIISNGGATAKTLAGAITVNGDLTINSGATLSGSSGTLNLFGNWTNSGTYTAATSTVNLRGTSKTLTGTTTFNALTVFGSYTSAAGTNLTINSTATINSGATLTGGTGTITFSGNVTNSGTYSSSGTTTFSGTSAQALTFAGTALNLNIVNFNGSVSPTISSSSSPTFATLSINNTAGVTPSIGWTVTTSFTVGAGGIFNGSNLTHTINGSFTNNGTVSSSGTLSFVPSSAKTIQLVGTSFASTGTVSFGGTGALLVTGTPNTLTNVTISNTSGVTPASNWSLAGNFSINAGGIFNAGSYSYTIAQNFSSTGTFNGGTSTVTLSGAGAHISGNSSTTFYDLVFNGSITADEDFNVSRNFTLNGTYAGSAANMYMTGSTNATIGGTASTYQIANLYIQKTSGGVVTLGHNVTAVEELAINSGTLATSTFSIAQAAGGDLSISANALLKLDGTNTLPTFSTYNLATQSTVEYAGGTQSVSGAASYGNLVISGASGSKTVAANLTVLGNFTLSSSTFVAGSFTVNLAGNWTMSGGSFTTNTSTVNFNGTTNQTISSTGAFNNIIVNKALGDIVLASDLTVKGLTFTAGNIQTTTSFKVIIPSGGAISGADQSTGWVDGILQKFVSTTTGSFEVGGPTYYSPLLYTLTSLTTSGNLIAKATAGAHPNVAGTGFNSYIQRYWTLSKPVSGGVVYSNLTLTFNWNEADNYSPIDPLLEEVALYASGSWSFPTLNASFTATEVSNSVTGVTILGDFVVGEKCSVATEFSYSATPYCSNSGIATVTLEPGSSLGTFSATPAGLSLNPTTGDITLASSTPGTYTVTNTKTGNGGCISTFSTNITISMAPNATISYSGNPLCTLDNLGNVTVAGYTGAGTSGGMFSANSGSLSINSVSGQINISTSTAGTYTVTYTVAANGGCSQYQTNTSVTIIQAGIWTGATSTAWNIAGNWSCGGAPTTSTNVIIPTGLTNYPQLTSGTGDCKNITIQSGASVTVNGGTLKISGTIINNGTFTASNGTIEFKGSSAQTIAANTFAGNTLKGLTVNNTSGVTLAGALNLTDVLTVSAGTFNTGDYLVLKSTATATARVAQITSAAATPISGKVTAERYIQGRRKYRLMASPVTTSPLATLPVGQESLSIWGAWQNSGNNTTGNVGTIITGGASGDGFDQQTTNASLYTYDDVNRRYIGFTSANSKKTKYTPLQAGICYYMFVYGDRLNAVNAISPNSTTLSAKGTLLTGDQAYTTSSSIPLTGVVGRYTMLGNPFASPIDWTSVQKTNIANTYWGWDPNLSSTGGYVTVNSSGNITLIAPFTGSVGLNQYIQSGQGFFVRTTAALPTLTIREQDKVSNYNANAFKIQSNNVPLVAVNLYSDNNGAKTMIDGALIAFDRSFKKELAKEDAAKLISSGEVLGITHGEEVMSIDGRPVPSEADTVQLYSGKLTRSQYTLQIFTSGMDTVNLQPYLEDRFLKTTLPLAVNDTNWVSFTISSDVASSDTSRFRIILRPINNAGVSVTLTGTKQQSKIALHWNISAENGIAKYIVQRSATGTSFTTQTEVVANGTPVYEWIDANPVSGKNYYRVLPVFANGNSFESNIILIEREAQTPLVTIVPNPVKGAHFTLKAIDLPQGKYQVQLYNGEGKLVKQQKIEHTGGMLSQFIDINQKLSAGIYYLQLVSQKEAYRQRLFIE